jgi:hypothetical protein
MILSSLSDTAQILHVTRGQGMKVVYGSDRVEEHQGLDEHGPQELDGPRECAHNGAHDGRFAG